jgi:DNA-binding MarR family transcriptional regulator
MAAGRDGDGDRGLECVCFNLRKATRSITHVYDAALRASGLRATQFTVLKVVQRLGSAGVTRIADVAVLDRTTLTRSLAVLERGGLVRVLPSPDGRERVYALTPRGERVLARAHQRWNAAQDQVVALLGAARVQRLLGDLGKVVHAARGERRAAHAATRSRR